MRFTYKEKSAPTPILIAGTATLVVVAVIRSASDKHNPFYPYDFVAILTIFLIVWANHFLLLIKNKKNPSDIIINEYGVTIPAGKTNEFIKFEDIDKLFTVKYDEGNSDTSVDSMKTIFITKNNKRYEFEDCKFHSPAEFKSFNRLMKLSCNNLSPVK